MPNTQGEVLAKLKTACHHCFSQQMDLLREAERVSSQSKEQMILVFLQLREVAVLSPFPSISEDQMAVLSTITDHLNTVTDHEQLAALKIELANWMGQFHDTNLKPESLSLHPLTDNLLNRRMIDLLFLMKDKIRSARRRLQAEGDAFDRAAYVAARNQANLTQAVFIDQLHRDIVTTNNEDVATVEQVLYPAIEQATGANFVVNIEQLVSFMRERIQKVFA